MALKIELTSGWAPERMADVWPSVLACIRKFAAEFPDEVSENSLVAALIQGRQQLWVVYAEEEPLSAVLAVITEAKINTDTQKRHIEITAIGGERIREALPLLETIERAAVEDGANRSVLIGRLGWKPLLRERGYSIKAVLMEKRLDKGLEEDGK